MEVELKILLNYFIGTAGSGKSTLTGALKDYIILGIQVPIEYLISIMSHPAFIKGETYTSFIGNHMTDWKPVGTQINEETKLAMLTSALVQFHRKTPAMGPGEVAEMPSLWQTLGRWENV